jgi:hypothetical protein
MRSPRPSASSSSVVVDLIVRMRSGADFTVTVVSQFSTVIGNEVSAPAAAVGVVDSAGAPAAHPLSSNAAVTTVAAARAGVRSFMGPI